MVMSLEPAERLDPGCGCGNGAGWLSRCASFRKAARASSFVIPQRAERHTGGGVGTVVGGGCVMGAALGSVGAGGAADGAGCSFFPQPARTARMQAPASADRRAGSVMATPSADRRGDG